MEVGGEKREFFEDRLPPQLSVKVIELSDVPYESWSDANRPIDILLIVENDFELSSCLSFLDQPFKSDNKEVGHVYFGRIGNASNEEKLKVALAKCSKAAASPEGSLTMAMTAVEVLQPKAVFFVGTSNGLSSKKVSLGDVVIPSSLTAAVGSKVFASPRLGDLAKDVTNHWVAPLQNPDALEVKVHHGGNILKQSLTVDCTYDDLHELYPEALAVETESEGISLEAYDDIIEWVIVKGVTSYFNQTKSSTSGWMSFASTMAASIVASMLKDPVVFRKWPHYSQGHRTFSGAGLRKMEEYTMPFQTRLRDLEERVLISSKGSPSEVEELMRMISEARFETMEEYTMRFQTTLRDLQERVFMSCKRCSPNEVEELMRMISEARFETMEEYAMCFLTRLRDLEERVLMSSKGSPSEVEELMRMISEARFEVMEVFFSEYAITLQTRLRDLKECVRRSSKDSPSEVQELMRMISEARFETMEGYRMRFRTRLRDLQERVLMSSKGSPSEVEELMRMISGARFETMEEFLRMGSEARFETMEEYRMRSRTKLGDLEERVLMSSKGSPSEEEELMRMISEARFEAKEEYRLRFRTRLGDLEERVRMSSKGSPSEVEELMRMISGARFEAKEGYRMRFRTRMRHLQERVLMSSKGSLSEVEASDVKEGKGDKKAVDEQGKQYSGNEGKDDEGGVEAAKTEIQGQEHYEQGSRDDDPSEQTSEMTGEDLIHGIHELQMEEQEELDKVTIFEGTVTSEGFHLDLNVGAIHLTFPPDAVAEPTDIMVYRWKYGACLPQLTEHEAVVSNVVEISAATEDRALKFNSEVKLVLSHSAADLEGYELVLKRLTDMEMNEWEETAECEDIRQVSGIEDDYPFPVVQAGITKCSTYAVVSRLKMSPAYTITVSGGTFAHPDYPQVTITVPEKAVETETKLSLQLKVQEVPQDKFQGHNLFAGPILRILCSSRAAFLEPVTIQLPLSLRGSVVKFSDPSVCRVRVFYLCSEQETKEWIEISDELENPAIYDGKLVKFKVQHFCVLTYVIDRATDIFSAVSSKITSYLSSFTLSPSLVAFFFAYFKPGQSLNGHDILFLTCCPAHLREEVKQEHEKKPGTHSFVSSNREMVPGHDKAFVSVWGGIRRPLSLGDMEDFYLCLYSDTQHNAQLEVCQESDQAFCRVKFCDEDSNLLANLYLKLPSPTIDRQETPGAVNRNPARVSFRGGRGSPSEVVCAGGRCYRLRAPNSTSGSN